MILELSLIQRIQKILNQHELPADIALALIREYVFAYHAERSKP